MKLKEQHEARRMRSHEGFSVGEIARRLGVSKSTVSVWVRDIALSDAQIARLAERNPVYNGQYLASKLSQERHRRTRAVHQQAGRDKARERDPLHLAGCMLYWAEGSKRRSVVCFTNSDPNMMAFFLGFLRRCYDVQDEDVSVSVNCFDDCLSVQEIEEFWLNTLQMPGTQLRKGTVNCFSRQSQRKRQGTLKYGTCRLTVSRTSIVQSIYGAIQEYAGFSCDKWLD